METLLPKEGIKIEDYLIIDTDNSPVIEELKRDRPLEEEPFVNVIKNLIGNTGRRYSICVFNNDSFIVNVTFTEVLSGTMYDVTSESLPVFMTSSLASSYWQNNDRIKLKECAKFVRKLFVSLVPCTLVVVFFLVKGSSLWTDRRNYSIFSKCVTNYNLNPNDFEVKYSLDVDQNHEAVIAVYKVISSELFNVYGSSVLSFLRT